MRAHLQQVGKAVETLGVVAAGRVQQRRAEEEHVTLRGTGGQQPSANMGRPAVREQASERAE
eukprot:2450452-Prymnesium_polylepis.1